MIKRSTQVVLASLGFGTGVIASQLLPLKVSWWWLVIIGLAFVLFVWRKHKLAPILLIPLFCLLGISYVNTRMALTQAPQLANYVGKHVRISGRVNGTPHWDNQGLYEFEITNPQLNDHKTSGVLRIKTLSSFVSEGDLIKSSGKLYHAAGRAEAQLIYAPITRLDQVHSWQLRVKEAMTTSLAIVFPRPVNQFMEGLMIGDRSGLPQEIQNQLADLGLSHIIAVSGYNLTIVVLMCTYLLKNKWKWLGLVISLWVIAAFVLVTGATASVVRAGLMSIIFILVRYYGRTISLTTALFLTLALTLAVSPSNYSDIGWQLSFAALAGIIFLTDPLKQLLPKKDSWLITIVVVSLAAQITTLPLVAYYFGSLSIIAPVANAIFLPVVEILSMVGFVASAFAFVIPQLAPLLFAPFNLVVRVLLHLAKVLDSFHFSHILVSKPAITTMLLYYGLVVCLVFLGLPARRRLRYNKKKDSYERTQQMA